MKKLSGMVALACGLLTQGGCATSAASPVCLVTHDTPSGQKVASGLTEQDYAWLTTSLWAKHKRALDLSSVRTKSEMQVVQSVAQTANRLSFYKRIYSPSLQIAIDNELKALSTSTGFQSLQQVGNLPEWVVYGRCQSNWEVIDDKTINIDLQLRGKGDQTHLSRRRFVKIDGQWKLDGLEVLSVSPKATADPR